MNSKIDIVIPWVDGNDIEWLKEKKKYMPELCIDAADNRYRDWGLLKYWFRGIEKNASWVNKIYFVTWGHIPSWLNTSNPKLKIIRHEDYMPEEYLPTFNSNTILSNLYRIKGLSENFVVFNDDLYLISKTKDTDFFINNIPCDNAALNIHCPKRSESIQNVCFNNAGIINDYFNFREVIKQNKKIWYNFHNGKELFRTIILRKSPRFPGFYHHHLPQGYRKETFEKVWKLEFNYLNKVSKNKFRTSEDVNEWLFKDWQIVEGKIIVRKGKLGKVFHLNDNLMPEQGKEVADTIKNKKIKCIAINDCQLTGNKSKQCLESIVSAFEKILPDKSSFEK